MKKEKKKKLIKLKKEDKEREKTKKIKIKGKNKKSLYEIAGKFAIEPRIGCKFWTFSKYIQLNYARYFWDKRFRDSHRRFTKEERLNTHRRIDASP